MFYKRMLGLIYFGIAYGLNLSAWADEIDASLQLKVISTIDVDLIPGISNQKILLLKQDAEISSDGVVLIGDVEGKQNVVLKADRALPHIKNVYSPASFDGFDIGYLKGAGGLIQVVDIQGEVAQYKYEAATPDDVFNLVSREEDNGAHSFNVQFQYSDSSKKIQVGRVLYLTSNESCDRSLIGTYVVPRTSLNLKALEGFDGVNAFHDLKQVHVDIQSGRKDRYKLMPISVESVFDTALVAYKKGEKEKLKELLSYLLMDGASDNYCPPETYIAEKYYFQNNVRWSNDLGFMFAEAGYYGEAVELLEAVILGSPERVVAYLNLADAYWGLNSKERSIEMYKKYSALMQASGNFTKVPQRVADRILM